MFAQPAIGAVVSSGGVLLIVIALFIIFTVTLAILSRLKKCPSDRVMVIFGADLFHRRTDQHAARCLHGGTAFIWPVIQDYGFLSLRPIQLEVNLRNALCKQNIRINVPSVFTVSISTDEALMGNAANRLLGLSPDAIGELAKDIIFGQLRLVIASMTIEQINSDRETFLRSIEQNVAEELNKIGLLLLNVNITDITDESGYIDAIGKRAASEAINKARIEVAEEERKGGIGEAEARKSQRIAVSQAEAQAQSGEADADKQRRIAVTQAEAQAQAGEADADRQRRISIKQAEAEALIGEAEAEKQRRIATKQAEAEAINGENISAIEIAQSNAARIEKEAEAYRQAEAAKRIAEAKIKQADFEAEQVAQAARAKMEMEKQKADTIVRAEIEKQQVEIQAEAEAEKLRREAKGQADAIYAKLEAEARGNFEILRAKGEGYNQIISACGNNADAASKMLLIEKLEELVRLQTEAIRNIKIDKVTVWDGGKSPDGKNATANFLSGMMQSLPPLHDVAGMAGVDLPAYLGKVQDTDKPASAAPAAK
ncbi:MAG: flotillin family protein [Lentisphaeria bacterium]|nr:flotillin family protein [Lentisphaeria bacterium]